MGTDTQEDLFHHEAEVWARKFSAPAPERALHSHSLEALDAKGEELCGRKAKIVAWLRANGAASDRNVKDALFGEGADMNTVRPRITELINSGVCHEVGSIVDSVTGLHVRLVRAKNEGEL